MSEMVELDALIERLSAAADSGRALDGAIHWHLFEENRAERERWWVELQFQTGAFTGDADWRRPYSSSLDAAVALAERLLPGTEWAISTLYGRNHAEVNMNAEEPVTASGATPALALCIAAIKAGAQGES